MESALTLSADSRSTAGILLLAIAVEWGGWHMLRIVRGRVPATAFQVSFARAGHAHAGVLVILSLVIQLFADAVDVSGPRTACRGQARRRRSASATPVSTATRRDSSTCGPVRTTRSWPGSSAATRSPA
jgi:hypothetical protein